MKTPTTRGGGRRSRAERRCGGRAQRPRCPTRLSPSPVRQAAPDTAQHTRCLVGQRAADDSGRRWERDQLPSPWSWHCSYHKGQRRPDCRLSLPLTGRPRPLPSAAEAAPARPPGGLTWTAPRSAAGWRSAQPRPPALCVLPESQSSGLTLAGLKTSTSELSPPGAHLSPLPAAPQSTQPGMGRTPGAVRARDRAAVGEVRLRSRVRSPATAASAPHPRPPPPLRNHLEETREPGVVTFRTVQKYTPRRCSKSTECWNQSRRQETAAGGPRAPAGPGSRSRACSHACASTGTARAEARSVAVLLCMRASASGQPRLTVVAQN